MNERNFEYLKDNIKYQGFGETLVGELENQLKKAPTEFSLQFKTQNNKKDIEATLHFKRSNSTDLYFFNKYDLRVETERKGESLSQTFYVNRGEGMTLKEGYNLLNGRAVFKELTDKEDRKYQAWVQLDFSTKDQNGNFERKQYHQNYGYDLREALSTFPIKELTLGEEREKLIKSLEKGNIQIATLETKSGEKKVFVEANPQYKTLNLYSDKMQRLTKDERQELSIRVDPREVRERLDKKEDQKKGPKEDLAGEMDPSKKKSRKKGLSI